MRKSKSGKCYVARIVMIHSLQTLAAIFVFGRVVLNTENMIKDSLDCSRKNFDALKSCVCVARHTALTILSNKFKFSSKWQNRRTFEDCGDGPNAKYWIVLDDTENVNSTNRGLCTKNHCVPTYEQTKKRLSYFHPKRIVEADGMHSLALQV